MGKVATMALIGENTVKDFRGHFQQIELGYKVGGKDKLFKTQVMPTFSPGAALTKWEYDDYIIHDIKKAKKYAKTLELPKIPKHDFKLVLNLKDLERFVSRYIKAEEFATDYETTGLHFHKHEIINAGFADCKDFSTIVPMLEYTEEHMKKWEKRDRKLGKKINKFVKKHKKRIFKAVKKVNACKARKILHNGKFDYKFGKHNGIPYKNFYFDTILAHAILDENKYHDLNSCMEFEGLDYGPYDTGLWPWVNKDRKKKKSYQFIPVGMMCEYLAIDTTGDFRLYKKLQKKLDKQPELKKLMMKTQMPLVRLMADIEYKGCKLDLDLLRRIAKEFNGMIADIEEKVRKKTKLKDLNLSSPKQLLAYFTDANYPFEKMGIKKGKTGYSCGVETLNKFARKKKFAVIPNLILEHRAMMKLKSNYLDGKDGESGLVFFLDKKHKIHYSSNIHTPRTGRLSVTDPAVQTIPNPNPKYPQANIRKLFITSKKGNVIWGADFKQLELRVGAHLSQDRVMIKEIRNKVDLHVRNAVKFGTTLGFLPKKMTEKKFDKIRNYEPPKNWKKKYKGNKQKLKEIKRKIFEAEIYNGYRNMAKTLAFGLNYGMDANTIAQQYGMDVEDVQEMIDLYFIKYEGMYLWREDIMDQSIETGLLVLPDGRKRRFTSASNWFNSEFSQGCRKRDFDIAQIHRQASNFPIQGFANTIYTKGKIKLYKEMKKRKMKSRILISIHDGMIGEGPAHEMPLVKQLAKECMEMSLGKGKNKVPLLIDFDIFDRWYGKKIKMEDIEKKFAADSNDERRKAA